VQEENAEKLKLFCSRLRRARIALGLEPVAIAARWGFSENYVKMMESGKKPVPEKLEPKIIELELEADVKLKGSEVSTVLRDGAGASGDYENVALEKLMQYLANNLKTLPPPQDPMRGPALITIQSVVRELISREKK